MILDDDNLFIGREPVENFHFGPCCHDDAPQAEPLFLWWKPSTWYRSWLVFWWHRQWTWKMRWRRRRPMHGVPEQQAGRWRGRAPRSEC